MRRLTAPLAALALALALPAAAQDSLSLPPPPPPPDDGIPLPPPPAGTTRLTTGAEAPPVRPAPPPAVPGRAEDPSTLRPAPAGGTGRRGGVIGNGPVAFAGDAAAPLLPDESISHWKLSLASGVLGRYGGHQISDTRENPSTLIYFGGEADGQWTESFSHAARLRLKLMTGGEDEIFIPSDGEVEAAYMIGRPEFRFVVARLEVARYPNLALETLGQLATAPSIEGSLPLAGDRMRLYFYVSPVEMAWVYYYGGAHITVSDPAASESDAPAAATAARLRYTTLLPPSVLLSLQGDLLKMWKKPDLMLSAEGSLGYEVLDGSVVFNLAVRWTSYTRREAEIDATGTASDLKLMGMATLVF